MTASEESRLVVDGCVLIQTSCSCPEQYDVFLDDKQIGYLRLRHGIFRADYPDNCLAGGVTVYMAEPRGNGSFEDSERLGYLQNAVRKLLESHAITQAQKELN